MWATEIGPMGGDELNRLIPGGNYGWPLVSLGKIYNSNHVSERVAFNQPPPQTERRESLLVPLDARVRDVRQAPDGTIYVAIERDTQLGPGSTRLTPTGSVLRITPAD